MTGIDDPAKRPHRPEWIDDQIRIAGEPDWPVWPFVLKYGAPLISLFGRPQITGGVAPELRRGPLLLAANHIGNFDTIALAVAVRKVGLVPKFMITAGIMNAPLVGGWLTRAGNIRVNRGKSDAAVSMEIVHVALKHGAHIIIYPEGRVSLDPHMWPERGYTGLARLALETRVPVIPVSQWGAHEVTKYDENREMLTSTLTSIWRQPALRVHFGEPVSLDDLSPGRRGDAHRARMRILGAITRNLRPLRGTDLHEPRYVDHTRPIVPGGTAAFPGGVVPD